MHPEVERLAERSGELRTVTGRSVSGDRFTILRFEFEAGVLELTCNDDTDEIVALVTTTAREDLTDAALLNDVLGLAIEYAWELRNHRGYVDAFQLRLRNGTGRDATVQFEVAASAIDVRRLA